MPLKEYVPPFLLEYREFREIYDTQDEEVNALHRSIDDILAQCFVDKATWGLKYWEKFLGITVDETKPLEFRRSAIIAKLRGSGTITVNLIKNVAESFANGEVEVTENVAPYTFEVKFVGSRGIPPNLDDLKAAIEEIKPAHLAVVYEFSFTTWGEAKNATWGELKMGTWEELKTRMVI